MDDNYKHWCYWFKGDRAGLFDGPMCDLKGIPISDCIGCSMAKEKRTLDEMKQDWIKSMNIYIQKH